ncbi:anti-sigma factor family protein [Pelagibius sp.]|uniref:anti-sigma factor family protein n=1 Tax=Pelagibius sp. TaxID=1931238 RepID=UPI003BB06E81
MTLGGQEPPGKGARQAGNDNQVSEAELQAYVDGQLAAGGRVRIESYLAAHPAQADRLDSYRKQNIGLHSLFDARDGEDDLADLPPEMARLAGQLDHKFSRRRFAGGRLPRLAAGFALLFAAGLGGWLTHDQLSRHNDPLAAFNRQAAAAHAQVANHQAAGLSEAGADGGRVITWLADSPNGAGLQLPDLKDIGFELVADRVLPFSDSDAAAQLIYEDDNGQRITLYLRGGQNAAKSTFAFRREGEVSQFFWQDGRFAFSLIGMMAQGRLLEIAEAINAGFQGGTTAAVGTEASPAVQRDPPTPTTLPDALGDDKSNEILSPEAGVPPADSEATNPKLLPLRPLPAPLEDTVNSPEET